MKTLAKQTVVIQGAGGTLEIGAQDKVARQLAMLMEVKLTGLSVSEAAQKYGYSERRYYQIQEAFKLGGSEALQPQKAGPKSNHIRTPKVEPLVIRHRFLDPDANAAVVAQKLRQTGTKISERSVSRIIEEYGIQKKISTDSVPGKKFKR